MNLNGILYSDDARLFLTEFSKMILAIAKTVANVTKIQKLNEDGIFTSLYVKNLTSVESTITIPVKVKIRKSDIFLFSRKENLLRNIF